jgi:hypothetical protein
VQKALDALLDAWFKADGSAEEAVEVMTATVKGLRRKYADRRPWDEVGKKVASSGRKQKPPMLPRGVVALAHPGPHGNVSGSVGRQHPLHPGQDVFWFWHCLVPHTCSYYYVVCRKILSSKVRYDFSRLENYV